MFEEDVDLLGPPKRKRGRPPGVPDSHPRRVARPSPVLHDALAQHIQHNRPDVIDGKPSLHLQDVHAGVTVAWLGQVFGMDPTTVKKRLADCPVLHRRKAGFVYDLKQAAAFLVKPVFDVNKYLRNMKPSELPAQLQKEFWDAALKRQQWEERAGDLWRTTAVMEVFADVFLLMKSTMQLWTEDLERVTGLTAEQRSELVKLVDSLQNEIHGKLVGLGKVRRTPSMREEIVIEDPFAEEDLIG